MAGANPILVVTVAMVGFLLAVTVGILVLRDWSDYDPILPMERAGLFERTLSSPVAWTIAFLVGSLGLGGTITYWLMAPEPVQNTVATVAAAVIAVLIGLMVFTGVWEAIKSQGRSNSEAVGIGAIVLGLLFVAAIAANLVLG